MLKLTKKYRQDYTGEDIVTERAYEGGKWNTTTEHVPNNVINNQISNRAAVFGNGRSRLHMDPRYVINKKSGLLGADSLQTYACNAFFREYTPDFLIVTGDDIADEVIDRGYHGENIVYTRAHISLRYPRAFYLIPYDLYGDAGTMALYIACFDGHKRIYMMGFDGHDTPGINNNIYADTHGYDKLQADMNDAKWVENQLAVFNAYDDVDFVWVTPIGNSPMPDSWKYCMNLRQIPYKLMISEADL